MGKKVRTPRQYSVEEKMKIVNMNIEEGIGILRIAELQGICRSQVQRWISTYKKHGEVGLERKVKSKDDRKPMKKSTFKSKDDELQYLKAENAYLKKLLEYQRGDGLKL